MTSDDCATMEFLLQADADGELDIAGTAALAAHLARCPACADKQAALVRLSKGIRGGVTRHAAPDHLRRAVAAALPRSGAAVGPSAPAARVVKAPARIWRGAAWLRPVLPMGVGAALAAALVLLVVLPRGGDLADSVVASHIRALQPGHLMDVVSTDQHTVKPWFDGKLDYAPPVKDLAVQGFPLIGGRLDYLADRPVAALAYRRDKHIIDLYVWPRTATIAAPPADGQHDGYNVVRWTSGEMVFWAVSDVERSQLEDFYHLWQAAP